jgi:hypothetical protein
MLETEKLIAHKLLLLLHTSCYYVLEAGIRNPSRTNCLRKTALTRKVPARNTTQNSRIRICFGYCFYLLSNKHYFSLLSANFISCIFITRIPLWIKNQYESHRKHIPFILNGCNLIQFFFIIKFSNNLKINWAESNFLPNFQQIKF